MSPKSECRKFSPNIFNKSKCQNCFRTKESHSAEALESNRCIRKGTKCGYLFVAPDWDFSVSINRTKRWQRRWFVLYDDGELTYSVDEHPDTIPQAVIDMNKALEVSDAEEITGNQFAIAITAPEKVHFIKGTSREESKWWYDMLSMLPRNNIRHGGKHKRNATFPGGTATTIIIDHSSADSQSFCASEEDDSPVRQRFTSESVICKRKSVDEDWAGWLDDDVFPTKDSNNQDPLQLVTKDKEGDSSEKNEADNSKKGRCRRYLKREARALRNQRSRSDGVAKMIPNRDANQEDTLPKTGLDGTSEDKWNSPVPTRRRHTSEKGSGVQIIPKSELLESLEAALLIPPKPAKKSLKKSESLMDIASELSPEMKQHISELKRNHSYKGTLHSKKESTNDKTSCGPFLQPVRDTSSKSQSLPSESSPNTTSSWETGVDICSQGMVLKKGWLLRRPNNLSKDEWSKHWFVLKNASCTYYRDPSAEDCGILDGVLDLNQVTSVEPIEMEKYFAFSLIMWDNKKYVLSTISASARSNWIKAIQNASNLWDAESRKDFSNDEIVLPDHHIAAEKSSEQGQQDLSSSDDQSEYFSIIDDGEDDGTVNERTSSPRTLPPSPPLNRTAMSLVKERAKIRCSSSPMMETMENCKYQEEETFSEDFKMYQDIYSKLMDNSLQFSSSESEGTKKETKADVKPLYVKNQIRKGAGNEMVDDPSDKNLPYECRNLTESRLLRLLNGDKIKALSESCNGDNEFKLKYELLKAKYLHDSVEWENRIKKERASFLKGTQLGCYMKLLQRTKRTVHELNEKFNSSPVDLSVQSTYVTAAKDIQQLCKDIGKMSPCCEKKQKREIEVKKWKKTLTDIQTLCKEQEQKLGDEQARNSSLTTEIHKADKIIRDLQQELQVLNRERLNYFTDPMVVDSSSRNAPDSEDILKKMSDRLRITEDQVRRLKKDLKISHSSLDDLEIYCFQLKHDVKLREENHLSQMGLMTARVDDLTSKLTLSERNFRQMKQKVAKLESKQERRRSSLKNKESISLSKECESKLFDLEQKLLSIENELKFDDRLSSKEENPDRERVLCKRLSQDSCSGSENTGSLLLRLHTLGMRTKAASDTLRRQSSVSSDSLFDKPKICLQVRGEDVGAQEDEDDDCGEDWSALSYTTSLTDLQALDGLDSCELVTSVPDFVECLDLKFENLISWVKCSINAIQKHETFLSDNNSNSVINDSSGVMTKLLEVLDSLTEVKIEEDTYSKLCYKMILMNEFVKAVHRLRYLESSTHLEKGPVCYQVYNFMQTYLHYLNNLENQNTTDLTSCHSYIDKLLLLTSTFHENEFSDDCVQTNTDQMALLIENTTSLVNVLDETKYKQFSAILHVLADIPVQDAEVNGEKIVLAEDLQSLDPLLLNITAVVHQVHQMASCHLKSSCRQRFSLLACDRFSSTELSHRLQSTLKEEIDAIIDELKNLYPQVREKNFYSWNLNCLSYKRIIIASVALSMTGVLRAVSRTILGFLSQSSRNNTPSDEDTKDWMVQLQDHCRSMILTFTDAQVLKHDSNACLNLILNHILESAMREMSIENIFYDLHQRKIDALRLEVDVVNSENAKLKTLCDLTKAETEDLQCKMKKMESLSCVDCRSWENQIQSIKKHHETDLYTLDKKCKEKMEQMQKHLQFVLDQKDEIHAQEVQKLDEQLQAARILANRLEVEYNEQVQNLKELYQKNMFPSHEAINEESVRRRYHADIEQLKELWEKGLVAIQNSYRQITLELERRHKQEMSMLEVEKEKLLQEETQATLTALEVMRKFHAEELQRELTRCKEEFFRKMNSEQQTEALRQSQELEMSDVKREILALSEKYSIKCLESASLDDKLQTLQQQLEEAHHQVFDLTARNKQLKVQLSVEIAQLQQNCSQLNENMPESEESLKLHLKLKEAEIAQQVEMNAQSKQELHLAQMHVSLLDVQCEQLYQSLHAERKLREDEVQSLRGRLEAILAASLAHVEEPSLKPAGSRTWNGSGSFLYRSPSLSLIPTPVRDKLNTSLQNITQAKELLRSPSWSGIEDFTSA